MIRTCLRSAAQGLLIGLALLLSANQAAATLGQSPSVSGPVAASTAPAARALAATSRDQSSLYTLHTTQLENRTIVQEYATPSGQVFAVLWRGPVLPDLSALLGAYFKNFKAEIEHARAMGRRGSPVVLASDTLVVKSAGRMRRFFGYAYAPDLIPAGLEIKDVLQ